MQEREETIMNKISEIHSNFKKDIQDCLKECEGACEHYVRNSKCECEKSHLVVLLEELQEYRKLGTLEELKSLKEKQEQRDKWEKMTVSCKHCGYKYLNDGVYKLPKYCNGCGRELQL